MRRQPDSLTPPGKTLVRRLEELGRVSDDAEALTRTFLSPAMFRANQLVGEWMREAGLGVREDQTGNLIGRGEARGASPVDSRGRRAGRREATPKTLLLGSHLDTVRNAGRFDGALGVVLPIVALAELRRQRIELPFAVEILGFSEEEVVRFPCAYIGSKAYTGQLRAADLKVRDANGMTLNAALEQRSGTRYSLPKPAHRAEDLIGYCEVHIEQGPVLEAENLALGVVSAIASQTRGRMTFRGKAGHAGTTPMSLRRDALAGAAEFVLFAETFAASRPPLVATVGSLTVPAAASNVIPRETIVSLDVRHPSEVKCRQAVAQLVRAAETIARRRKLTCEWQQTMQHHATRCSTALTDLMRESVSALQPRCPELVSGAGHDAVVMAELTSVAMLFVRCRDGLSHHPGEYVSPGDLDVALRALMNFILRLAGQVSR